MNTKEARRINALKKAKKKRTIMIAACALSVVALSTLLIAHALRGEAVRVFSAAPNQVVTLYEDGSFVAHLPHNVTKAGTFTEHTEGDITAISFIHSGRTEAGSITAFGDTHFLTIPETWDDGCGHGRDFLLR